MKLEMKSKSLIWLFFGMFAGIGGLFVVLGIALYINDLKFFEKAEPARAVITDFERSSSDDSNSTIISYMANGKQLTGALGYYSSGMSIGDTLTVYYRPQNPLDIKYKGASKLFLFIFTGIGLPFMIIGIIGIVLKLRGKSKARRLKENGICIVAEVTDVVLNMSVSMNGRHPIKVTCEAKAPDGTTRSYRSGNVWRDPDEVQLHSKVAVYQDPNKPESFYVDVEGSLDDDSK